MRRSCGGVQSLRLACDRQSDGKDRAAAVGAVGGDNGSVHRFDKAARDRKSKSGAGSDLIRLWHAIELIKNMFEIVLRDAFTFIGGPAYDTNNSGSLTSADSTKIRTTVGARATAPFIVDQHLVFGTGNSVEIFGDPQDFNNGVGQAGVRILSWREVR